MRINITAPAPAAMMETMMFAKPANEVMQYIHQRNDQLANYLQTNYGQAGVSFIQNSNKFYEDYSQSAGIKAAEIIVLSSNNALAANSGQLVYLSTIEELQSASTNYQRYLMANPIISDLYYQGRIDGYGETFIDTEPGKVGLERDDFRSVVNGMGRSCWDPKFESEDETWIQLSNSDSDSGNGLNFTEKTNVLKAYALQAMAVQAGIDPTSIDGFDVRPK